MLSNKDIRIENGYIIINGEKYPFVGDVSEIEGDVEDLDERITALEEDSGVITLNTEGGWLFDSAVVNKVKKQGKVAWITSYILNSNNLTQGTVYQLGTLPVGFVPTKPMTFPIYRKENSSLHGIVTIETDGKIYYRSVDGNRYAIYTTIMYPLS